MPRLFSLSTAISTLLLSATAALANKGGIPNYGNSWQVPELDPGLLVSGFALTIGGALLVLEGCRARRRRDKRP